MFILREAARTLFLGLIVASMAYTTIQVTFFNGSASAFARQGLETPTAIEPLS